MRIVELRRAADGALRVVGVYEQPFLPPDTPQVRYMALATGDPAPLAGWRWDGTAFVDDGYMPPPAPPQPVVSGPLSRLAFLSRFTEDEQVAIEVVQESHPVAELRAAIRVIDRMVLAADEVRLDDPRTALGVQRLVEFGLLTPERAAQVLDPTWESSPS